MYTPQRSKIESHADIYKLISSYSFGILMTPSLEATHLPFILAQDEGELGTLYSHCAKSNPHWQQLEKKEVLVVFNGPHAYISPSCYEKGPAAPTWNYAIAHVLGIASLVDEATTCHIVDQTVAHNEPQLLTDRKIVTEDFRDQLLPMIVGFKIEIKQMDGKQKLGQHRSPGDQLGVLQYLDSSADYSSRALAQYMRKVQIGTGHQ